jgi:hypothetical protein
MAYTFTITRSFIGPDGVTITDSKSVECDAQLASIDVDVPASTTDQLVVWTADVSQVKALQIQADGALTLETNSAGSPADTIALLANQPYQYITGDYNALLLGTDVTALYLTNAGASSVNIKIRGGYDPTP